MRYTFLGMRATRMSPAKTWLSVATARVRAATRLWRTIQRNRLWVQRGATRYEVGVGLLHHGINSTQLGCLLCRESALLWALHTIIDRIGKCYIACDAFLSLGGKQRGELTECALCKMPTALFIISSNGSFAKKKKKKKTAWDNYCILQISTQQLAIR